LKGPHVDRDVEQRVGLAIPLVLVAPLPKPRRIPLCNRPRQVVVGMRIYVSYASGGWDPGPQSRQRFADALDRNQVSMTKAAMPGTKRTAVIQGRSGAPRRGDRTSQSIHRLSCIRSTSGQ
jgi:hypothetical protein